MMIGDGCWEFFSREVPSKPALLMVLTFLVMPPEPSPSPSSRCCLCFRLRQSRKRTPPAIANIPTTPPTTPPTMAPVLELPLLCPLLAGADEGVMTTVRVMTTPLSVTTVGTVMGSSSVADGVVCTAGTV